MKAITRASVNTKNARAPMITVFASPASLTITVSTGATAFSTSPSNTSGTSDTTVPAYFKLVVFGTLMHALLFSSGLVPGAHLIQVP
jgi:hypothetical protein